MTSKPSGTVTFLFTDIENSTQLAREHPETWEAARARHYAILRKAIERNNGFVFQVIGDAFCAAFHKAGDALKAAISAQQNLQNELWGNATIYVRMGIHTGEAEFDGNDYRGYTALSFAQRLMSAGHGGQILVSNTTENLLREQLPGQISLRDMGPQKFAGVPSPTRIFQVIAPDLPIEFPPLRTIDNLPNNLPLQLTSFVGREKELADVKRLLQNTHLLTLIGPGGTGKTRLSIQTASEILDQYPDGIWFVELAPILDPQLVPRTTAIAIGLRDEPQRPIIDMLCDYLRDKKMLLVLDNCEHLVDACAGMADRILHAAPDMRILASSREALGIAGEVTYRVPSLRLPNLSHIPPIESLSQFEAIKLFIDRATAAVPTFRDTNENASALAQICHHLDGIPLAIELAAAKIRILSLQQIAQRLDDRFRLLTGGSRTAMERHQTLHAAIDWSYNLLSATEQVLFQRLSVFVGGWRLEAAESICADEAIKREDVLNLLEQLINKSLVIAETVGHESRYHMLETIRQYANEKLVRTGQSDSLLDKHLAYFLELAEDAEPHLIRKEQLEWLSLLATDHENLRFALQWALSKESAQLSLRLCAALGRFWTIRGYGTESSSWLASALAKPINDQDNAERSAHVRALFQDIELSTDLQQIKKSSELSLKLAQEGVDKPAIAIARFYVGFALHWLGNNSEALPLLELSYSEFQELNDPFWIAYIYRWLSEVKLVLGKIDPREKAKQGLKLARAAGERSSLVDALVDYSFWLFVFGHIDDARAAVEEAIPISEQIGLKTEFTTFALALIEWLNGNRKQARALYMQSQERLALLGLQNGQREFYMINHGLLALEDGDLSYAQICWDEALKTFRGFQAQGDANAKNDVARILAWQSVLFYMQGKVESCKQNLKESISITKDLDESRKAHLLVSLLILPYFQIQKTSILFLGTIARVEEKMERPIDQLLKPYCLRTEAYTRKTFGNEIFETAFAEGQNLPLDNVLDLALKTVEKITEINLQADTGMEESVNPTTFPSQREMEKQKYGGLTAREREVAAQIAHGKSNQAIAAELFVGLKTVEAHVTRILTKLGFTSRAQIAGWAVAKGLAEAPRDLDTLGRQG